MKDESSLSFCIVGKISKAPRLLFWYYILIISKRYIPYLDDRGPFKALISGIVTLIFVISYVNRKNFTIHKDCVNVKQPIEAVKIYLTTINCMNRWAVVNLSLCLLKKIYCTRLK